GGKPGTHFLHAAECPDRNVSVRVSAPGTAPMLEPQQFFRRLSYENFDGILVAKPVATRDGVVGMVVQRILRLDYPGGPAFGRNRVATHRVNLRNHSYPEFGIGLGHGDGSSKAGATAADDQYVMFVGCEFLVHAFTVTGTSPHLRRPLSGARRSPRDPARTGWSQATRMWCTSINGE